MSKDTCPYALLSQLIVHVLGTYRMYISILMVMSGLACSQLILTKLDQDGFEKETWQMNACRASNDLHPSCQGSTLVAATHAEPALYHISCCAKSSSYSRWQQLQQQHPAAAAAATGDLLAGRRVQKLLHCAAGVSMRVYGAQILWQGCIPKLMLGSCSAVT